MSFLRSRLRSLTAIAGVAVLGGIAVATVIPRDLSKQLELIKADAGGVVVYGSITASKAASLASSPNLHWTILTVHVDTAIAPATTAGDLSVWVPGFGENRLTISPPEEETRVGENVVLFLSPDADVRAVDANAYRLTSFAEAFRTQKNRKGDVVVLGEGAGSAIEGNVKLADLSPVVQDAYAALLKSPKNK